MLALVEIKTNRKVIDDEIPIEKYTLSVIKGLKFLMKHLSRDEFRNLAFKVINKIGKQ